MESVRLYRYYKTHNSGPRWLLYQFLFLDAKLRHKFNMGPDCGIVTFLTWIMLLIIIVCSFTGSTFTASTQKEFMELQKEANKKMPRKKSLTDIRPMYNCIHKHLQQTDVFQEKTKKMLCKERLELEILSSKINCISKLLKPEGWQVKRNSSQETNASHQSTKKPRFREAIIREAYERARDA